MVSDDDFRDLRDSLNSIIRLLEGMHPPAPPGNIIVLCHPPVPGPCHHGFDTFKAYMESFGWHYHGPPGQGGGQADGPT